MKVRFPENNKIFYSQDFSYFIGIPSNVEFKATILENNKERIRLVASNYGGEPYGNGALYISKKDLLNYSFMTLFDTIAFKEQIDSSEKENNYKLNEVIENIQRTLFKADGKFREQKDIRKMTVEKLINLLLPNDIIFDIK